VFEHVADGPKNFKSFKELDKFLEREQLSVDAKSPQQLKAHQEERKHRILKGENPAKNGKKKQLKVPEKIDKAFRECPTVESAIRALKEDRV
jgi:hypothetical protein